MAKFKAWLQRAMAGRYGADSLYYFLLILYFALFVLNLFVGSAILVLLMYALPVVIIFRMLSRNVEKRRAENEKFLALRDRVTKSFRLARNRVRERKTHVYKKCPSCKAMLRFTRKPGKHTATCPRCHQPFEFEVR